MRQGVQISTIIIPCEEFVFVCRTPYLYTCTRYMCDSINVFIDDAPTAMKTVSLEDDVACLF